MGLYRTKPEEVEAVQYTGNFDSPFQGTIPAWVWAFFSKGNLNFTSHGMEVEYNGLVEPVAPTDWLVLHADNIVRVCDDKTFKTYYTPGRKRMTKAEAKEAKAQSAASATVEPVGISAAASGWAA